MMGISLFSVPKFRGGAIRSLKLGWAMWAVWTAVLAACWSLGIFERPPKGSKAKTLGVARQYPWFVRAAFGWLVVSALLACAGDSCGWTGASRHAFTVGFLATLIFALGPRILPSFVNSRELWSKPLMLAALVLLTAGCALRVGTEPLAYGGAAPAAWNLLPVSAILELAGVTGFAVNFGMTLALPFPAWIEPESITADLPVYWYISAYPRTRGILARAGLVSLAEEGKVPRALSLRAAAAADHVDEQRLLAALRAYFEQRMARVLREKRRA
jgi:hypothetical protein